MPSFLHPRVLNVFCVSPKWFLRLPLFFFSRLYSGTPGIDLFLGRECTPPQLDRIVAMIAGEGLEHIPIWARQYARFIGHGSDVEYVYDGDFGWYDRLEESSLSLFEANWDVGIKEEVQ